MEEKYIKKFDEWNVEKAIADATDSNKIVIREGAIWLAKLGVNIGSEVDGKGAKFARPVIVFRKVNSNLFIGIPVSSKIKENYFRVTFKMLNEDRVAIISQIRSYDKKRCIRLIEMISKEDLNKVEKRVSEFLVKAETPQSDLVIEGNLDCLIGHSSDNVIKL